MLYMDMIDLRLASLGEGVEDRLILGWHNGVADKANQNQETIFKSFFRMGTLTSIHLEMFSKINNAS